MPEDRRGAERLAELFEHALALPQEDRRRYARDTCRDEPELCAELVSLLAAYEEAPNYLERVAPRLRQAALTPTESVTPSSTSDRGIQTEVRLRVGQRFGHYEIGRLLGRGGMSEVWEAEDLDTGRHVALKALGWSLHSAADHSRFLREGRLAARVNHPNIVYVFGTEEIDGVPVIAMELASGGTLKDLVAAEGPMRPARAVDVVLQVIAGLDAAAGVLHRDIKPSNCFVEADGRIQIGDFGIAAATTVQPDATLTGTVGLLCTPTFASPEQLRGAPLDVRSDIYAVGGTLYYLLSGRPPFDDANAVRLIERVLHERPPGVRTVRHDVPRPLDSIVQQCLAKDPAERPPSYGHLSKLLLPYRSASPAPAPLGLRMLALIIDAMIVRPVGAVLPFFVLTQWRQQMFVSALEWLAFILAHLVLVVAYFGVSEGVWSASPGKMVVGLRVVGTGRRPLGVGRALARACLWCLLAPVPGGLAWVALWPSEPGTAAWSALLPAYLAAMAMTVTGIGILFSRARRANGFAGLHDLATQTRVVLKPAVEPTSTHASALEAPPVLPPALTRLGPYLVLDETAAPGVVVGFDERLARRVWIRHAPPGAPAVSLARRSIGRPTRLRWLTGSRDTDGGWDAYEAAVGDSLRNASQRLRTWATVRGWLQDLAQEMLTAGKDDTDLPLSIDRVWVTNGRARLLDWLPGGGEGANPSPECNSRDVRGAQRFLCDVATLGLFVEQPGRNRAVHPAGLPLHARELLDDLASERFDTTAAIVERLQSLVTRAVTITRARRCAHLAMCGAAPLIGTMVFVPAWVVLLSLLAQSPDAFLIDACLRRLERLEYSSSPDAARERAAVETYLVGRFRPLLTESTSRKPWFWPLIEIRQSAVQRALARQPNPSAEEIERAAQQLAGLVAAAQRDHELAARGLLGWRLALVGILLLIAASAVPAVLSALVARGGAIFRLLGIAVVGQDGREVSRLRALARALIAWTPGFAALVLLLPFATLRSIEDVPLAQLSPSLLLLSIFVAGAVFALFNENHGLQDRIVRTSLVAR